MERCVNSEQLAQYEAKVSKEETDYDSMIKELVNELEIDHNEIISRFDKIVDRYGFTLNFEDFVSENLWKYANNA